MTTDEERREVARRLRGLDYSDLQESLICAYLDALGIKGYEDWIGIAHRLADLIEPGELKTTCIAEVKIEGEKLDEVVNRAIAEYTGIDRDALLRLARYMDKDVAETEAHFSNVISTKSVSDYARRIREACGEVER